MRRGHYRKREFRNNTIFKLYLLNTEYIYGNGEIMIEISKSKPVGSDMNKYGAGRSVLLYFKNRSPQHVRGRLVKVGIVMNYYRYF